MYPLQFLGVLLSLELLLGRFHDFGRAILPLFVLFPHGVRPPISAGCYAQASCANATFRLALLPGDHRFHRRRVSKLLCARRRAAIANDWDDAIVPSWWG